MDNLSLHLGQHHHWLVQLVVSYDLSQSSQKGFFFFFLICHCIEIIVIAV